MLGCGIPASRTIQGPGRHVYRFWLFGVALNTIACPALLITADPDLGGLVHPAQAALAALAALVLQLEALGFSTLLIWDHLDAQLAPLPALVAAAGATTTLRLGTQVLANDIRHPALLAREAATVDLLSGGRLELGVGAGWNAAEYRQAGLLFADGSTRVARLRESVQILKRLWAGGPLSYTGEHYQLDGLVSHPRPVQRPHPPLMIGGARRQLLTLAAEEANAEAARD